jgi:uncharacterized membrane protein
LHFRSGAPTEGRSTRQDLSDDRLAKLLGWASLGLGVPLALRPTEASRAIGTGAGSRQVAVAAAVGARELVAAAGLLSRPKPAWLWARVAGDGMDLALLGIALRNSAVGNSNRQSLRRTLAATASVVAITAIDLYAATSRTPRGSTMELTATTTIGKSTQEVYDFWRQFDRLPTFMAHLDEVRMTGEGRSHWQASAPFGRTVEWDAETIEDVPGERIRWRSIEGADVPNEGTVEFRSAPGDRGTELHVRLSYDIPGGKLGKAVARYFGEEPHQQLDDDLRRLKQVLETGEVVRSDGAPGGKRARQEFPQHPAQPLSADELAEFGQEVSA